MKKSIAPLLAAALLCCSCPTDSASGDDGPVDITVPVDLMGMVHAGSRTPIAGNANVQTQFDLLDEIGVKWILDDFSWSTIQPEEKKDAPGGEWNWSGFDTYVANANARGKKILAILDYDTEWLHDGRKKDEQGNDIRVPVTDYMGSTVQEILYNDDHVGRCIIGADEITRFCAYVRATVTRYNGENGYGKVDAWNIWNEPNLVPRFWTGTMDDFWKLSIAAAKTIREADPDAVIVVGALNSIATDEWIRGLYNSGTTQQANFVGYHPYTTNATGTEINYRSFVDKSAPAFRSRIWITEVGHPTGGNYPTMVPATRMPQTIVKTVVLLAAGGAQKIFWYHLAETVPRNNPNDSENWFGLYTREDGVLTPKGYLPDAYKLVADHIPGKIWRKDGLSGLNLPSNAQSHYFEGADGKSVLVVWNDSAYNTITVEINLPGKNHVLYNPANAASSPVPASDIYTLSLRDSPNEKVLFFTWDAE